MKFKVTFLASLILIACVFAAGCTSSVTTSPTPSPAASTTVSPGGHDKTLQAVINDDKQTYVKAAWTRTVNETIQWSNDTTAMVTFKLGYSNGTLNYTALYVKFPTIGDASRYVNSISSGYSTADAIQLSLDPALTTATSVNTHQNYKNVTGSSPTTLTALFKPIRDTPTQYTNRYVIQTNEVVVIYDATVQKAR